MLESIISLLSQMPWEWIILCAFLTTFLENVFPPSPGDSLLVFIGALIGIKSIDFTPILISATLGSTVGFATMYIIGSRLSYLVLDKNKFKFISRDLLKKVEYWFSKYGYWLIIGNRFLSGTRAVISFFAGISKLNFNITMILSTISSLIWNFILLYFGYSFGDNWQEIDNYLSMYGKIVFPIIILIVIAIVIYQKFYKKKSSETNESNDK